ncbi:MAG: hypothetical protein ACYC7H_10965, partial [Chloroflexota bacterium]
MSMLGKPRGRYLRLAAALVLVAIMVLTSCSAGGSPAPAATTAPGATKAPAPAQSGGQKLTILVSSGTTHQGIQEAAKGWAEKNGVEVEVVGLAYANLREKIILEGQAKS